MLAPVASETRKLVECQQGDQGVLDGRPQTGCDEERSDLVAVQVDGAALVVEPGPAYVHRRGDGQQALLFGVAVRTRPQCTSGGRQLLVPVPAPPGRVRSTRCQLVALRTTSHGARYTT